MQQSNTGMSTPSYNPRSSTLSRGVFIWWAGRSTSRPELKLPAWRLRRACTMDAAWNPGACAQWCCGLRSELYGCDGWSRHIPRPEAKAARRAAAREEALICHSSGRVRFLQRRGDANELQTTDATDCFRSRMQKARPADLGSKDNRGKGRTVCCDVRGRRAERCIAAGRTYSAG